MKRPELIGGAPEVLVPPVDKQAVLERMRRVSPPAGGPPARAPRAPRRVRARPAPPDGAAVVGLAR